MSEITKGTRLESYIQRPVRRCDVILDLFDRHNSPMSARMVARALGFHDMNMVRPRINELVKAGWLVECGKAYDNTTSRNVAVWMIKKGDC